MTPITNELISVPADLFRIVVRYFPKSGREDAKASLAGCIGEARRIFDEEIRMQDDIALYFRDLDEYEFFEQEKQKQKIEKAAICRRKKRRPAPTRTNDAIETV